MEKISKTAAIKVARKAVGQIIRRSNSDYVFYAPYYDHKPAGPSVELQACTYTAAKAKRTQKTADVALALMGHSKAVVFVGEDANNVQELVNAGIVQAAAGYPLYIPF